MAIVAEEVKDPFVGMSFENFIQVKNYMKAYMDREHEIFTMSNGCKKIPTTECDSKNLVYTRIKYACKRGGQKYRPQTTGIRQTSTCKVDCPAFILICRSKNKETLEIVKLDVIHQNHDGSQATYKYYPENRRLSPQEEEEVRKDLSLKCNKKHLREQIVAETGKFVTLKDLTNIQSKLKNTDKLSLKNVTKFLEEKGATFSISKQGNEFKGLYFSTPDMKNSIMAWPEIVCIDGTYSLLNNGLTLMLIIVEDSNGSANIVAVGLLASEDYQTLYWFLNIFKENNKEACTKIRSFMADKDMVVRRIVKELFVDTPIYICLFHTLQAFKRAITKDAMNLSLQDRKISMNLLMKLAYSSSEKHYIEQYKIFSEQVPKIVLEYFNKNWHNIKEDWTVYSMKHGNLMNRTNNRLESMNQKIKQIVMKRSTLMDFITSFFTFLNSQMIEVNYKASKNYMKRKTGHSEGSDEQKYLDLLTDKGFTTVLQELRHRDIKIIDIQQDNNTCFIKDGLVKIKVTDISCECTIWSSSLLPCRHIFATRKALGLPLFHEELCNARWTKKYYQQTQRLFEPHPIANKPIPLLCEIELPCAKTVEGRLTIIKPVIKSLVNIISSSCNLAFSAKINILKEMKAIWNDGYDISIDEFVEEDGVSTTNITNLNDSMQKLDMNGKKPAVKIYSFPKKRKIVIPILNDLADSCTLLSGVAFQRKLDALKQIKDLWSNGISVNVNKINSEDINNFESSQVKDDQNIERIILPPPVKMKGHPRHSLITTPLMKQKNRKKHPAIRSKKTDINIILPILVDVKPSTSNEENYQLLTASFPDGGKNENDREKDGSCS